MSDHGGFDWEAVEDITVLSEGDLKERLAGLVEQERVVSYRRRVLQGRIDLMRAKLVKRGAVARTSEELVRALMGEWHR
jgi:hypothetical protein